jgi:hypothetical protein
MSIAQSRRSAIGQVRPFGRDWRNVRLGSKTEAAARHGDVRFTLEPGPGSRVYDWRPNNGYVRGTLIDVWAVFRTCRHMSAKARAFAASVEREFEAEE